MSCGYNNLSTPQSRSNCSIAASHFPWPLLLISAHSRPWDTLSDCHAIGRDRDSKLLSCSENICHTWASRCGLWWYCLFWSIFRTAERDNNIYLLSYIPRISSSIWSWNRDRTKVQYIYSGCGREYSIGAACVVVDLSWIVWTVAEDMHGTCDGNMLVLLLLGPVCRLTDSLCRSPFLELVCPSFREGAGLMHISWLVWLSWLAELSQGRRIKKVGYW